MRALITGGAGFIGSHIAERLIAEGHDVTVLDNLATGRQENVPLAARFIFEDIRRPQSLPGPWDVIYHCAATYADPSAWEVDAQTNVVGTINVVREALSSGARLVYFQTSLCYGLSPASPVRLDAPLAPKGSYAVSKTAGESYVRGSGVDFVSLRLANMYGPRNLSGPVPTFYKRLAAGEPCTVVDSRRDFVFVDDLVDVAVKAATQGSGIYHVGSGADCPIIVLYDLVRKAMGLEQDNEVGIKPRGPDDAATILLDPTRTEAEFGWRASTSLGDGIRRAVEWYRAHGVQRTYTHLEMVR